MYNFYLAFKMLLIGPFLIQHLTPYTNTFTTDSNIPNYQTHMSDYYQKSRLALISLTTSLLQFPRYKAISISNNHRCNSVQLKKEKEDERANHEKRDHGEKRWSTATRRVRH